VRELVSLQLFLPLELLSTFLVGCGVEQITDVHFRWVHMDTTDVFGQAVLIGEGFVTYVTRGWTLLKIIPVVIFLMLF